jgi:hypothetical protein
MNEAQFALTPARVRAAPAPVYTVHTDPAQIAMPWRAESAVQAQAARDQAGRGGILPSCQQSPADEGLFAYRPKQKGCLL